MIKIKKIMKMKIRTPGKRIIENVLVERATSDFSDHPII